MVFEGFDRAGTLRAICGGGRYDRLLGTFGGEVRGLWSLGAWPLRWRAGGNCTQLAAACVLDCMPVLTLPRCFTHADLQDQPCAGFGFGDAVIVELLKDKKLLPQVGAWGRHAGDASVCRQQGWLSIVSLVSCCCSLHTLTGLPSAPVLPCRAAATPSG